MVLKISSNHQPAQSFIDRASKIASQHAYRILRPELLELVAGRSFIAWQMVDSADRLLPPEQQVRANMPRRLEDHCACATRVYSSIWQDRYGIDD